MTGTSDNDQMLFLRSRWQRGTDFLEHFEDTADGGVLFHPLEHGDPPEGVTAGSILHVRIALSDREFDLHARVVEQTKEGLRLAFLTEERTRLELVLTSARGESLPYFRRRHERILCRLPVVLETPDGARAESTTISISEGGTKAALGDFGFTVAEDDKLQVTLTFPLTGEKLSLQSRVASVVLHGPQPSFGVEFRFSSAAQRDALRDQVRTIREKGW